MQEKHFDSWVKLKERLHFGASAPRISDGDVWWCGCGENVGVEINGKGSRFSRPVLVMKKLGYRGFMGIPLTTQEKTGPWYVSFTFLGRVQFAAISQARVMSTSRLFTRIGQVPDTDLVIVKNAFLKLYK